MRVSSTIACPTIGWIQRMESWKSGEVFTTISDKVSPNATGVKRKKRHMKIPKRVIIIPTTVKRSDDLNVRSICPPVIPRGTLDCDYSACQQFVFRWFLKLAGKM